MKKSTLKTVLFWAIVAPVLGFFVLCAVFIANAEAQEATAAANLESQKVEVKPPWTKFVQAPLDKMPKLSDLMPAVQEAVEKCEDKQVICTPVASGGYEAPDCHRHTYGSAAWQRCERHNHDLAINRQNLCRDKVAEVGGVYKHMDTALLMGISGERGRGVTLSCYKESYEYLVARTGGLEQRVGDLARTLENAGRELADMKKCDPPNRLVGGVCYPPEPPPPPPPPPAIVTTEPGGAFNALRVFAGPRVVGDTKRGQDPAVFIGLGAEFDISLGVSYESYLAALYLAGIGQTSNAWGFSQGAAVQWRFPVPMDPDKEILIWLGPEAGVVAFQPAFGTSDEILVGGGLAAGFEWRWLALMASGQAANYGNREDGVAGLTFVWSVTALATVPHDGLAREDRFKRRAALKAERERLRTPAARP